jgi:hypothetical protein
MSKLGKPSKCTEVLICRLVEHVERGSSGVQAAMLAGVGRSTFHEWRQRAQREPDSIYARLFRRIEEAELTVGARAAGVVVDLLGSEEPRVRLAAARFFLERRQPDEWGPRREVRLAGHEGGAVGIEVSGPQGSPIPVEVRPPRTPWTDAELRDMTPEQLEQAVGLVLRLHGAGQTPGLDTLFTTQQIQTMGPAHLAALARAAKAGEA